MLKINKIKKEKNVNNVGAISIARKPQRNTITNVGADAHVYPTTKKCNIGVGADASVCPSTKAYNNRRGTGHRAQEPAAITLVALVITVIILIILAGVSLNLALGENGIFTKSKQAVDKYKDSAQKEQNEMDNLYNTLVGLTDEGADTVAENKPNAPVIPKDLPENTTMQLVKYENGAWVSDTEGTSWSYVAGTGNEDNTSSHWANAKVTIDGVESFFVWIPRFAYKITYYKDADKTPVDEDTPTPTQYGKIDVVFLQGTGDTYIDEEGKTQTAKRVTDEGADPKTDYIVHPAFTKTQKEDGTLTYDNGEWSEELAGLWIGKYETSHTGCTEYATSGEGTLNENKIKIQPGITSWRNDTIGNFYTAAKEYEANLNSHMLKNSEWGAVAYLTHSQYGRNGKEVGHNDSSNYITGTGNNDATSTGNEYGIYDLRGGACEYVAAYYNGGSTLSTYGSSFASQNGTSDEYATVYTGTTASSNYKKGDATYETSGWNSDYTRFVYSDSPFFYHGGDYYNVSYAGVFYCSGGEGVSSKWFSFRLCLAVM